jgi:hypothetical protein
LVELLAIPIYSYCEKQIGLSSTSYLADSRQRFFLTNNKGLPSHTSDEHSTVCCPDDPIQWLVS